MATAPAAERLAARLRGQAVHWATLDRLVVDYAFFHGALDDNINGELAEDQRAFGRHVGLLKDLRQLILDGDVAGAGSLLECSHHEILMDHQVIYRLRQQQARLWCTEHLARAELDARAQFVETLRRGQVDAAIHFARDVLARMVNSAAAQAEFRQLFSLVLYSPEQAQSPRRHEWSLARRDELAALVHARMMTSMGVHEPLFALLMRHLSTTHNVFHFTQGVTTTFDEVDRLLVSLPGDEYMADVGQAAEPAPGRQADEDQRALVQALSIPRVTAQRALARSRGSVGRAMRQELSNIQLNHDLLLSLTLDYLHFRGLLAPGSDMYQHGMGASARPRVTSKLKRSAAVMMGVDGPSTPETLPPVSYLENLHRIRRDIAAGVDDPGQILERITAIAPDFVTRHPTLAFKLRLREVLAALPRKDFQHAMQVIRSSITPLAHANSSIADAAVHLILMVVYQTSATGQVPNAATPPASLTTSTEALASAVFGALASMLGVDEPRLSALMRYLLAVHSEQFAADADRFERLFLLPQLKRAEQCDGSDTYRPPDAEAMADEVDALRVPERRRHAFHEAPPAPPPPAISDDEIREIAITTLMEVMQYPRERAVELLRQTDYDLDAVFMELV